MEDWLDEFAAPTTESEEPEENEDKKEEVRFDEFFANFGHFFKYAMIENFAAKSELPKFLLFHTTKEGKQPRALKQYKADVAEGQKSVFFIAADNLAEAENNPALVKFRELGVEVLLLTSPLDESALAQANYEGLSFVDITKESASLDFLPAQKDAEERLRKREEDKEFEQLFAFLKECDVSGKTFKVRLSARLAANTPFLFSASDFGQSAHMQKVLRAHNLSGKQDPQAMFGGLRVLDVNADHPAVKKLDALVRKNKKDPEVRRMAKLLLDAAAVASGYELLDKKEFTDYFLAKASTQLLNTEVEELVEEGEKKEEKETVVNGEDETDL